MDKISLFRIIVNNTRSVGWCADSTRSGRRTSALLPCNNSPATHRDALAQRSASAAKEIKGPIAHSVDRAKAGSNLVNEAGETMTGVVHAVNRVADLMGEISAASLEQHTGIEQINTAVAPNDKKTRRATGFVI
jgi:hypothetical protein